LRILYLDICTPSIKSSLHEHTGHGMTMPDRGAHADRANEGNSNSNNSKSLLASIVRWLQIKKYQYEVTFSLYMLTATEKIIFSMSLPFQHFHGPLHSTDSTSKGL
jgi:hypothetical protein